MRAFSGRLLAAHEEERALIARELHDDVLQSVAVLIGELDAKAQAPTPISDTNKQWLGEYREEVVDLADDIGRIARRMHPAVLDHLGLQAAIETIAREFGKTEGIRVEVDASLHHKPRSLPKEISTSLYRIAQEALRNVASHAQVDHAAVSVKEVDGGIQLVIEDTGRGMPKDWEFRNQGLGLTSMTERIRLVNGRFSVHSQTGLGTRVEAWVPLRRATP